MEPDLRHKMQPLKELLANTIDQLHTVLETQIFVTVCRGFWDGMGQVDRLCSHKIFSIYPPCYYTCILMELFIAGHAKVSRRQERKQILV